MNQVVLIGGGCASHLPIFFSRVKKTGLVVMIFLAGCASVQESGKTMESRVAAVAQSRWNALLNKDYDTAYAMMSPATRSVTTKSEFLRKAGFVSWLSAKVDSAECSAPDLCSVKVSVRYGYANKRIGHVENLQFIQEAWRMVDGQWWFVPAEN